MKKYQRENGFGITLSRNNTFESKKYNTFIVVDNDVAVDNDENSCLTAVEHSTDSLRYATKFGIDVLVKTQQVAESILKQCVTVINNDKETHILGEVCSAYTDCVCYNGGQDIAKRLSDGSILIHFCFNKWQGEGQWRTVTPEDIGIYPKTTHDFETVSTVISSYSSWSTATYFPLVIVEDKERNECWYFELEGGYGWKIELGAYGGFSTKSLFVKVGELSDINAFERVLQSGERHESMPCIYGVVAGGFEEVVKVLIDYKRATCEKSVFPDIVFNDYMNCNWAQINEERLLGLIDKAAELGVQTFCIDDGWETKQGLWFADEEKFPTLTLAGVIQRIKDKGMLPGIWFEFEMVPETLKDTLGTDEIFLKRNGKSVSPFRPLGNFRSPALIKYLHERIQSVYDMGVRYIKNDHNNPEGVGTNQYGESNAFGTRKNYEAFLGFIKDVQEKYPDLIIENCASGAMRSDWGTLQHFHLQSVSDQETYYYNPSIIGGSLALMPPERMGVWCYPAPLLFDNRENHILPANEIARHQDGEETIFNVVNAFLGKMCLSGRIEQMDEKNISLLKEGMDLYKGYWDFIANAYPVYPKGRIRMSQEDEYTLGLISKDRNACLLAVWNLSKEPKTVETDLTKYGFEACELIYPTNQTIVHDFSNGILKCVFPAGKMGRLFFVRK